MATNRKIEKTLSAGKGRGEEGRRKRKREVMKRKKQKLKQRKKKRNRNRERNKRNKNRNNRGGARGKKNKKNKKQRKNNKIVSEIFEDSHYDLDFIKELRNGDPPAESSRSRKRSKRKKAREEEKIDKKLSKLWRDWLPQPGASVRDMLRLRMEDCNWEDFTGHSEDLQLIPRSTFQFGDMVQMIQPRQNPFNISAADEDSEFDDDGSAESRGLEKGEKLERKFENLDIAMYNVVEDPEERVDLRHQFPEIFEELKRNVLRHLEDIVPEDFPPQDMSGHPRRFEGNFSPGWCSAR